MNKSKTITLGLCLFVAAATTNSYAISDAPSSTINNPNTISKKFYIRGDILIDSADLEQHKDRITLKPKDLKNRAIVGINGGIGYKFNDHLRTDINIQYRSYDFKITQKNFFFAGFDSNIGEGEFTSLAAFVNGYVDLPLSNKLIPYLTAGAGFMNNSFEETYDSILTTAQNSKGSHTVPAFNVGLGVSMDFTDRSVIDLGYRYIFTGSPATKEVPKYTANELTVGIAYYF